MRPIVLSLLVAASFTMPASGQDLPCQSATFGVTALGGQELRIGIAHQFEIVMAPYKNLQGWTLRVSPIGSEDDWTYPVNAPLDGEAQSFGAGWGLTARERLQGTRRVRFALNASDYALYSQLADTALHSPDPAAAPAFLAHLTTGNFGSIVLSGFHMEMEDSSEAVKSATFKITIFLPRAAVANFNGAPSPCD